MMTRGVTNKHDTNGVWSRDETLLNAQLHTLVRLSLNENRVK